MYCYRIEHEARAGGWRCRSGSCSISSSGGSNRAWESVKGPRVAVEGRAGGRWTAVKGFEVFAVQHENFGMAEKQNGRPATVSSPREAVQIRPAGHQGDDVAREGRTSNDGRRV